jgi:hypothetical protein
VGNEKPLDRYEQFMDTTVDEGMRLPLVKATGYDEKSITAKSFSSYFNSVDKLEKAKVQANV